MEYIPVIAKCFIIGFFISMPVSPIGILCLRRSMEYGPRIGFFSGLGSATADFIVSIIAILGLSFIMRNMNIHKGYLTLFGSIYFILLGAYVLHHPPKKPAAGPVSASILHSYLSILLLTLSNPTTIISFGALFAGIGVHMVSNLVEPIILATTVFFGAVAWWALLAGIMVAIHPYIQYTLLKKVNTVCGVIILTFGIITLLQILCIIW